MCMGGGGSTKVSTPKPPPLPPPLPPPAPPKPPKPAAKPLQEPGQAPDIRIGTAKRQSTTARRTSESTNRSQSLSIGNNQGMNL